MGMDVLDGSGLCESEYLAACDLRIHDFLLILIDRYTHVYGDIYCYRLTRLLADIHTYLCARIISVSIFRGRCVADFVS